jgi:hypothetical protein
MIDLRRVLRGPSRGKEAWSIRVAVLVTTLLLLVVLNPEVRLFLLFVDAIGVDVVLLLFATQFGGWWSVAASGSMIAFDRGARLMGWLGRAAKWWSRVFVPREGVWIAADAMATAIGSLFVAEG